MRRVLIVERDATARALMHRVLGAMGVVVTAASTADEVAVGAAFDVGIVDELAGGRALEELGRVRARYPTLPVVLTGTMLSSAVLIQAMRLGAAEAVPKPFTPAELRDAVGRTLARGAPSYGDALEFSAAVGLARRALGSGQPSDARELLAQAHALSPLDAESMALEALVAEIEGRDADAGRAYRAALALRHEEDGPPPHPLEGLDRLAAYGDARPVARLPAPLRAAPAWLVGQAAELATPPPEIATAARWVAVIPLGLGDGSGASYARAGERRGFVLLTSAAGADSLSRALDALELGASVVSSASSGSIDAAQVERQRGGADLGTPAS